MQINLKLKKKLLETFQKLFLIKKTVSIKKICGTMLIQGGIEILHSLAENGTNCPEKE